ncbi:MAG TPA: hypothetical protein VNZ22_06030, partial [Bacillota bacterium]|nr:hypothetical protein [Bacillota bacterium]
LNWSPDKTYFFLISVLSPPGAPAEVAEEPNEDRQPGEERVHDEADGDESSEWVSDQPQAAFPQLVEKELAVVVRARNSVVAAWLWRRYAASTPLARNAIRIDALCEVVPMGGNHG